MIFWRISEYADLSGQGGRLGAARWHTQGRPVVYLTESPASALLERIVHLFNDEDGGLPASYQLLEVSAPDGIDIQHLNTLAPTDWRERATFTQQLGDGWLASGNSALARVPSVIVPHTWNFLLNPAHPDAARVTIDSATRERFDNRLFRFGIR